MLECKKCGHKIQEEMSFCPSCGAPLKAEQTAVEKRPSAPERPRGEKVEKQEKQEKHEKQEKQEKHEKGGYSFMGPLIGGIILLIIGVTSYLQVTGTIVIDSRIVGAFLLIIVGIVIIFGALYAMTMMKRRSPPT